MRLAQIPVGALQFDFTELQQQEKEWKHVNMNILAVSLQILHKLHLEIIEELRLCEKHISHLNIKV